MIGAAAMSLSSVTVCLNALRLRFFKATQVDQDSSQVQKQEQKALQIKVLVDTNLDSSYKTTQSLDSSKDQSKKKETPKKGEDIQNLALFAIQGMTEAVDQNNITIGLFMVPSVKKVEVFLSPAYAYVQSKKPLSKDDLAKAIAEEGYETIATNTGATLVWPFKPNQVINAQADWQALFESLMEKDISWLLVDLANHQITVYGQTLDTPTLSQMVALWSKKQSIEEIPPQKVVFDVEGMSCAHCQSRVQEALEQVPGVKTVEVNLEKGQAYLEGFEKMSKAPCIEAIQQAGYEVPSLQVCSKFVLKDQENLARVDKSHLEDLLQALKGNGVSWIMFDESTLSFQICGSDLDDVGLEEKFEQIGLSIA